MRFPDSRPHRVGLGLPRGETLRSNVRPQLSCAQKDGMEKVGFRASKMTGFA